MGPWGQRPTPQAKGPGPPPPTPPAPLQELCGREEHLPSYFLLPFNQEKETHRRPAEQYGNDPRHGTAQQRCQPSSSRAGLGWAPCPGTAGVAQAQPCARRVTLSHRATPGPAARAHKWHIVALPPLQRDGNANALPLGTKGQCLLGPSRGLHLPNHHSPIQRLSGRKLSWEQKKSAKST